MVNIGENMNNTRHPFDDLSYTLHVRSRGRSSVSGDHRPIVLMPLGSAMENMHGKYG